MNNTQLQLAVTNATNAVTVATARIAQLDSTQAFATAQYNANHAIATQQLATAQATLATAQEALSNAPTK